MPKEQILHPTSGVKPDNQMQADDNRAEWERPALRRLSTSEAENMAGAGAGEPGRSHDS